MLLGMPFQFGISGTFWNKSKSGSYKRRSAEFHTDVHTHTTPRTTKLSRWSYRTLALSPIFLSWCCVLSTLLNPNDISKLSTRKKNIYIYIYVGRRLQNSNLPCKPKSRMRCGPAKYILDASSWPQTCQFDSDEFITQWINALRRLLLTSTAKTLPFNFPCERGFSFRAPKRVFRRHSCFDAILMYPDVHFLIRGVSRKRSKKNSPHQTDA